MEDLTLFYTVHHGDTKLEADSHEYGQVSFVGKEEPIRLEEGETLWNWHYVSDAEGKEARHKPLAIEVDEAEHHYVVYLNGEVIRLVLETPKDRRLSRLSVATAGGRSAAQLVRAPMPGLLKSVLVSEGETIAKGDSLCILEAMKMENEIASPGEYVVAGIMMEPGNPVEKGAVLLRLAPITE